MTQGYTGRIKTQIFNQQADTVWIRDPVITPNPISGAYLELEGRTNDRRVDSLPFRKAVFPPARGPWIHHFSSFMAHMARLLPESGYRNIISTLEEGALTNKGPRV